LDKGKEFILWYDQVGIENVPEVGGKNASLGEMYRILTPKGVSIPNGFATTAYAYRYFIEKNGLKEKIAKVLNGLNTSDMENLATRGHEIRTLIRNAEFPPELDAAIVESYKGLCKQYGDNTDVAVRSSATAEDLPEASFAGQQETFLNVRGDYALLTACKNCFASLFTNRAISYRVDKGFDHFSVALSIGVQKMVRSDMACSGVMFSIDTESGFKDVVLISGSWGLGENVVQGAVNPDEYYVFKPTLKMGKRPIITKTVGEKHIKMIYSMDGGKATKNIPTPEEDRKKFVLNDDEILKLAKWSCIIEDHYSQKAGHLKPMDMEWAKDGVSNELFIVQARPETVQSLKDFSQWEEYELKEKGKIIVTGHSVGEKIGAGEANVIKNVHDISQFKKGQVLITEMTDPDWEPIMKMASAIVTNRGGRTCFSGDTKILTNQGFRTMEQIYEIGFDGLTVPSLNLATKKMEWKQVKAVMKRKSERMKISVSQTGRIKDNILTLTPDHKMINIRDGEIVKTEVQDMIKNDEMLCISQKITSTNSTTEKDKQLAYLLGGIMTDGSIYKSRTHGEVQFIQKNVPEKQMFINHMKSCMTALYGKSFVPFEKKISSGFIRGKQVKGQATAYRLYSKQIAYDLDEQEQQIVTTLLQGDEQLSLQFLAGAIDGDGSFHNNRIQIYISDQKLFQGCVVACLRIGIMPQVTKNRNIYNLQIVEKLDEILSCTKRVKGSTRKDY
jgi:pyruvate,water dikinase